MARGFTWFVTGLLFVIVPTAANADKITFTNGRTVQCEEAWKGQDGYYYCSNEDKEKRYPSSLVKSIEITEPEKQPDKKRARKSFTNQDIQSQPTSKKTSSGIIINTKPDKLSESQTIDKISSEYLQKFKNSQRSLLLHWLDCGSRNHIEAGLLQTVNFDLGTYYVNYLVWKMLTHQNKIQVGKQLEVFQGIARTGFVVESAVRIFDSLNPSRLLARTGSARSIDILW